MMESIGSKEEGKEEQTSVSEWSEMALPGFRFHPTEEELVGYYLRRMVQGKRNCVELIASLDLYQYDPWELPAMAFMGEKEWFFFCPRDKKYPNGARPNRVTASGYWKATGTDRPVRCSGDSRCIGLKKTLVFYTGRAPKGNKTEWIMNEYRVPKPAERSVISSQTVVNSINVNYSFSNNDNFSIKNDVALCRIYRKSSSTFNSFSFLSAINARDPEESTSRMVSSVENSHPAAGAAAQQQHHHIQKLQEQRLPANTVNVRLSLSDHVVSMSSLPAEPDDHNQRGHEQQSTPKASGTSVTPLHAHDQVFVAIAETHRQEQLQQDDESAAHRSLDSGVGPSTMGCGTTSDEASRQLQIALRTAMAKLDWIGSSASANFHDGESSNGAGIFGRFRNRIYEASARAAADHDCPSSAVIRSPRAETLAACTAATAAVNHNCGNGSSPTTMNLEQFNHPRKSSSREVDVLGATPLLRNSSSIDAMSSGAAFTTFKRDPTWCSIPRISIPPSFNHDQHQVTSSPSSSTGTRTTCTAATTYTPRCTVSKYMRAEGAPAALGVIALHNIHKNNTTSGRSHISNSNLSQPEDEFQSLINARAIQPLTSNITHVVRCSRSTTAQPMVGEDCAAALVPSVAQYWRQSSSAPGSSAAAADAASPQLNTLDALSGLTYQYQN